MSGGNSKTDKQAANREVGETRTVEDGGTSGAQSSDATLPQRGISSRREERVEHCDCLFRDCSGCHYPCPKCSSTKCGARCKRKRRVLIDCVVVEGATVMDPSHSNYVDGSVRYAHKRVLTAFTRTKRKV